MSDFFQSLPTTRSFLRCRALPASQESTHSLFQQILPEAPTPESFQTSVALRQRWGRHLAELQSIFQETDPDMIRSELFNLARRLEENHLDAAVTIYSALTAEPSQAVEKLSPTAQAELSAIRDGAQLRLKAIRGEGAVLPQLEFQFQRLPGEMLSLSPWLAVGAAGFGFRLGRLFTVGTGRFASVGGGLVLGSAAMAGVESIIADTEPQMITDSFFRKWAAAGTLLLGLTAMGGVTGALMKPLTGYGGISRFGRVALPQAGLLLGIAGSGKLAELGGFSQEAPEGTWATLLSTWLRFNLMGELTRPLFRGSTESLDLLWTRSLEAKAPSQGVPPRWMEALARRRASAWVEAGRVPKTSQNPLLSNQSLMATSDGGAGRGLGAFKKTWPDSPAARDAAKHARAKLLAMSTEMPSPPPPPTSGTQPIAAVVAPELAISSSEPPAESLTLRRADPVLDSLPLELFDPNSLFSQPLIESYGRSLAQDVTLTIEVDPNREAVWGHPQLSEALRHMMGYLGDLLTGQAGPKILLQTKSAHLSAADLGELGFITAEGRIDPGKYMRIRIQDNGPAIDPHLFPSLFESQSHVRASRHSEEGFDLAQARRLVQSAGGFISAQSTFGGVTLDIYLPSLEQPLAPHQAGVAEAIRAAAKVFETTILVVDDEPALNVAVKRRLQRTGFKNVLEAADGDAALDMLSRRKYGLALIDNMLGKTTGRALIGRIRAKIDPDLPLALYTGGDTSELSDLQGTVGAIFSKPFDNVDLVTTLYRLVRRPG